MIECVNPNRAPTDCVQYYTGLAGQIESFNNNDGMIRNQNYMVSRFKNPWIDTYFIAYLFYT